MVSPICVSAALVPNQSQASSVRILTSGNKHGIVLLQTIPSLSLIPFLLATATRFQASQRQVFQESHLCQAENPNVDRLPLKKQAKEGPCGEL